LTNKILSAIPARVVSDSLEYLVGIQKPALFRLPKYRDFAPRLGKAGATDFAMGFARSGVRFPEVCW
jgi:hypothetical protein